MHVLRIRKPKGTMLIDALVICAALAILVGLLLPAFRMIGADGTQVPPQDILLNSGRVSQENPSPCMTPDSFFDQSWLAPADHATPILTPGADAFGIAKPGNTGLEDFRALSVYKQPTTANSEF